jgi:hypothetical protein
MKYFFSLILVFSAFLTSAQGVDYPKSFKESAVPTDLIKEGQVLIVMSPYKKKQAKETAALQQLFETQYTGEFVIVPDGEKFKNEYLDAKKYKYWLMFTSTTERKLHEYISVVFFDRSKFILEKPDTSGIMDTGLYDHHSRYDQMIGFLLARIKG